MSAGAATLTGLYFDGQRPVGEPATLIFTGREAALIGAQLSQRHGARELRVSPRVGRADRFVALPGGGQFQCADHPALDRLPHESQAEGLVAWLEARTAVALAGIALVAALLAGGYFYGLPAAAERVADRVPIETERALGEHALTWLDNNGWFKPTTVDEDLRFFINKEFEELRAGLPSARHLRLEFRASGIGPNAIALPGGAIVLTDAMVHEAESLDEIAAVLAHEIGHVERRHALRHLLQGSAVAVAAATLTADAASLGVAVAGLPTLLAQTKYSREFEAEADDYAFALLRQRGRSPEAFATLMERLGAKHEDKRFDLGFLSTHPVTTERVRRARAAAAAPNPREAQAPAPPPVP